MFFLTPLTGRAGFYILSGLSILMLILSGTITYVSQAFPYGQWHASSLWVYIIIASVMGGVLISFWTLASRLKPSAAALFLIFAVGLIARLMMFTSNPIMEDDWHRYLWDGASVANGIDPYQYAPAEASLSNPLGDKLSLSEDPELRRLQELSEDNKRVHSRINYPYVKTIYPPVAEGAFGMSHIIAPFNLNGWRGVLLGVDLISFVLIIWALGLFGRSYLWVGLYWWNPVVLLEVFNSGHMDGLIIPFLIAALGLVKLNKHGFAVTALAGAAAVKLWPILLAPLLVRKYMFDPKRLIPLALLFCTVTLALTWPQLRYVFTDPDQGLVAYSEGWQRHAFLYSILVEGPFSGFEDAVSSARIFVLMSVSAGALWLAWRNTGGLSDERGESDMAAGLLAITALLLFLSPTGYPWYQVWLAALIPFAPRLGFLVLTMTAPIYYTRFIFGDENLFYQWGWVSFAFGVPLILLLVPERYWQKRLLIPTVRHE